MAPEKLKSKKKKRTMWQRYRVAIVAGALVFIGLFGAIIKFALSAKPSVHKPPNIMAVQLPKPPPPPTPPPPTPPPEPPKPEEKTIPQEQPKEETKPVERPPEAPPALGSAIKGDGDNFGLSGSGDGVIGGIGNGSGGGDAKRWYAGQVQARAVTALRHHQLTRNASFGVKVRILIDATGRVAKVTLSGSTGNPAIDNAIQNEILSGLQLEQAPPDGKPMYVDMRLGARRPN